ncbi:MAG: peptidase C14 [Richelia sp. RM2_1_2]|nr:peptidase C14 [Richelia sp. SM2_1_7]NJM20741.1 peptidase C14 [Richelia sp. SM1_7_0]NJN06977.1 peptidase C14 [Richelia sp. RM1_1_1]NJO60180.1 peptidase C14 [Richelia sp. RM2_1_2]
MKRRIFLQRIGSILAVLGISELQWWTKVGRLQQALADSTPRKLALLVGINQYPQIPTLKGCLTDVEMQRELLIYRFGFQPSDILSLTNKQATREGIENAFLEHLVKQAKPGDVVVFHFSGYGSRIKIKSLLGGIENALIPVDGNSVIKEDEKVANFANYLLEDTLLLMMQSLASERVTAILDTSYYNYNQSTISQPIGCKIRSWNTSLEPQFLAEEIEFQKQLTKKIAPEKLSILLASNFNSKDLAKEIVFPDFSAGLFTYALTQYLWETTSANTIQTSLSRVGSSMLSLGSFQEPFLLGNKNQSKVLITENLLSDSVLGGEGAVTAVESDGKTVQLWLGGIPPQLLEYYGVNSRFSFYNPASPATTTLVLRSRNGLKAKATVKQLNDNQITPQIGQLVRETVRVLPKDINLKIALDDVSLERIERVDATSAFASIERVLTVIAGEQSADYLFAKLPNTEIPQVEANSLMGMSSSRYGLFTLGGELIPDTLGEEGEALKVAVYRLAPKLKTLLAAKLWKLTQNEGSSGLSVKATLEIVDNKKTPSIIMQRQTRRALGMELSKKTNDDLSSPGIPTVSTGNKIRYRLENTGDRPLYLILVGLNNSKNPIALYPWYKDKESAETNSKPELQQVLISPGESLIVPNSNIGFEWVISGPSFWCETQIIISTSPFIRTFKALQEGKHSTGDSHRISPLLNPLEVASSVLQDLNQASAKQTETQNFPADSWVWDVNHWTSFNFVFRVV